jgi:hypothetical protein
LTGLRESDAWTSNENRPLVVADPSTIPVELSRVIPCGNAPDTIVQINEPLPPVASSVVVYDCPKRVGGSARV